MENSIPQMVNFILVFFFAAAGISGSIALAFFLLPHMLRVSRAKEKVAKKIADPSDKGVRFLPPEVYDLLVNMHMNCIDIDSFMSLTFNGVTLAFANQQALAQFINTHNPGSELDAVAALVSCHQDTKVEPEVNHRREAILAQKARKLELAD